MEAASFIYKRSVYQRILFLFTEYKGKERKDMIEKIERKLDRHHAEYLLAKLVNCCLACTCRLLYIRWLYLPDAKIFQNVNVTVVPHSYATPS